VPARVANVKWISIVGTRPQFIKVSPVGRAIEARNQTGLAPLVEHRVLHTGQHYDHEMAGLIMQQLGLPAPDYNLGVGSGSHQEQLARMLERLEPTLSQENPDWVIVYGDTNSALAGALVAARLGIAVAHVEAGCRSYNGHMAEEQNRVLTDHLSQFLFAPSKCAVENLRKEGIGGIVDPRNRIVQFVGDVMYDTFLANHVHAEALAPATLERLGLQANQYYLLTVHRAENTTQPEQVHNILQIVESLDLPVLFPMHPRTRQLLACGETLHNGNIRVVPPLGYLELLAAGKYARKIITDSGGVQKEAFYLQVPCVTLRRETEWPETVTLGANRLVGTDRSEVLQAIGEPAPEFEQADPPFGDGHASNLIVDRLLGFRPA
jgi:UDP-GlcNAc3NAcA epimerase